MRICLDRTYEQWQGNEVAVFSMVEVVLMRLRQNVHPFGIVLRSHDDGFPGA